MPKHQLAIFSSGNGTNAEEIMKHFKDHPSIRVKLLLSNNPQAFALERAKKFKVPTRVFGKEHFRESDEVIGWLKDAGITHVILAGFMWLIPTNLIKAFPKNIVNIHPALLPKFGGKGMYGMKVHEAIKAAGESESGITIHLVNEHYDEGEILAQKTVAIASIDTPEDIANKVHQLEYKYYPAVIEAWIKAQDDDLKLRSVGPHRKGSDSLKLWGNSTE
jgi:phosphoribosylglycinamide formyltransferase 1